MIDLARRVGGGAKAVEEQAVTIRARHEARDGGSRAGRWVSWPLLARMESKTMKVSA